jgi:flagellin
MSTISSSLQTFQGPVTLDRNQDVLNNALTSLSSGTKTDNVAGDPVGTGVANALTSQNQRLNAVVSNIQNAVSYTQTGSSILDNVASVLSRMSQLIVLSQDPTMNAGDIANNQVEFQGLQNQLRNTIGGSTAEIGGTSGVASPLGTYDGTQIFGSASPGYQVAIGASPTESMTIPSTNLRTGALLSLIQQDSSGNFSLNVSSASTADLTAATQQVAGVQATFGAVQMRLNVVAAGVQTQSQNNTSTISQINDVDVAAASTQLATYNVLVQADAAMIAQANTNAEAVLKLLKQ